MPGDKRSKRPSAGGSNPINPPWHACAVAPILAKLSKHLALLALVLIIGGAAGKSAPAQVGILILVVFAVMLHSIARTLQRRAAVFGPPPRVAP